ncbi:MAG: antitoxin [Propionibacteriaceae bacterium]
MGLLDNISAAIGGHEDQVNDGIDKIGDLVDDKTGGQYAGQVDQAQDFLKSKVANVNAEPQA